MIRSLNPFAPLSRTQSSECLRAAYGAHADAMRDASEAVDAVVRQRVDTFVSGAPEQAVDRGTRLLRRVIETGIRDPQPAASTWFATLARMQQLIPSFASARRIAAFRVARCDEASVALDAAHRRLTDAAPAYADALAWAHQSLGALLRSIDWSGWTASCLAKLHTAEQLVALDAMVANRSYATALECCRHGAITGQQRLKDGADLTLAQPSDLALGVVELLGCEAVTLRMALADNPRQDLVGTRKVFERVYAPAMAAQLDAALSKQALGNLAHELAHPAVQRAFAAETEALPRTQTQTAKLLETAVAARLAPAYLGRCT